MIEEKEKQISKKKNNLNSKETTKKKTKSQLTKKKQSNKLKNKKVVKKQADDKSARMKKAKIIKKLFTWTILIGIIGGIIIFLFTSKLFKICNIEVTGNSQVSREKVLELSEINLEKNIFLSNIANAENKINENPYIKEVNVKRILPDKIKIEVVEKGKAYMLQVDGNYAYIDKNGYVLEITTSKSDNVISLQGYFTPKEQIVVGSSLNQEDLERLDDVQKIINSAEKNVFKDKISSITINEKNDYVLSLPMLGKIVYIGDISNLPTKMLRTKDILDKTMGKEGKIFVNGNFNKGFDPYFREEINNYF